VKGCCKLCVVCGVSSLVVGVCSRRCRYRARERERERDFCSTLDKMLQHSESLPKLHPQSATKLLRDCVCAAPIWHKFATLTLPKSLWLSLTTLFGAYGCASGGMGGGELVGCPLTIERARRKAFLPSRYDGVGLRSGESASAYAWFCSVASCIGLDDPSFDFARRALATASRDAYDHALDALGGPSYLATSKYELIPVAEPLMF